MAVEFRMPVTRGLKMLTVTELAIVDNVGPASRQGARVLVDDTGTVRAVPGQYLLAGFRRPPGGAGVHFNTR